MDIKDLGVFTIKVNLADAFMEDDHVRKSYEGLWVELREPTADEIVKSQSDEKFMMKIIPSLVIGHNIDSDGEPANNSDVGKKLQQSASLYTHVSKVWGEGLPLARKNPEMSETLPDASSEDSD